MRLVWLWLDRLATAAVLTSVGFLGWSFLRAPRTAEPSRLTEEIEIADAPTMGRGDAPVVMAVFSDFECTYCSRFALETLPTLRSEFVDTGKLRFIFKHHPLQNRPQGLKAAEAAECGGIQGQFWAVHDLLFMNRGALDPASLSTMVATLPLDTNAWRSCMTGETRERIANSRNEALRLGIQSTPFFVIGTIGSSGRLKSTSAITGAKPVGEFRKAIRKALGDEP